MASQGCVHDKQPDAKASRPAPCEIQMAKLCRAAAAGQPRHEGSQNQRQTFVDHRLARAAKTDCRLAVSLSRPGLFQASCWARPIFHYQHAGRHIATTCKVAAKHGPSQKRVQRCTTSIPRSGQSIGRDPGTAGCANKPTIASVLLHTRTPAPPPLGRVKLKPVSLQAAARPRAYTLTLCLAILG